MTRLSSIIKEQITEWHQSVAVVLIFAFEQVKLDQLMELRKFGFLCVTICKIVVDNAPNLKVLL